MNRGALRRSYWVGFEGGVGMGFNRDHGLWGLGLFLSAGLVVSTAIAVSALRQIKLSHQIITVKGYAEKPIVSDHGVWRGRFRVDGVDLQKAYAELAQQHDMVLMWLETAGVSPGITGSSSISTETVYRKDAQGRDTGEIAGFQLSQSVTVEGAELQLIARVARESTALIHKGIRFTSDAPEYHYTGIESLKVEMLGQAMKNAHARATAMAENSGAGVGPLVQASQGVYQITPPHDTEVDNYGRSDATTIPKVIKAVITADFAVR